MIAIYVSVGVIAAAFAILVLYLVKTLRATTKTLENVSVTIESLEKQLQGVTRETEQLLKHTNDLAEDIRNKTAVFNPFFQSVKSLGDSVQRVNRSVENVAQNITKQAENQSNQVAKAVQWGHVAIDIYSKWKEKQGKEKENKKH